jgi:hypothetical protein
MKRIRLSGMLDYARRHGLEQDVQQELALAKLEGRHLIQVWNYLYTTVSPVRAAPSTLWLKRKTDAPILGFPLSEWSEDCADKSPMLWEERAREQG